jgi:hypothetical protein
VLRKSEDDPMDDPMEFGDLFWNPQRRGALRADFCSVGSDWWVEEAWLLLPVKVGRSVEGSRRV